jgi:hypothetical protein
MVEKAVSVAIAGSHLQEPASHWGCREVHLVVSPELVPNLAFAAVLDSARSPED